MCKEHVDNNFRPLPAQFHDSLAAVSLDISAVLKDAADTIGNSRPEEIDVLRNRCESIKAKLSQLAREVYDLLQTGDDTNMTVAYVCVNLLQESQEFVTSLRKLLRASGKLNLRPNSYRSFSHH